MLKRHAWFWVIFALCPLVLWYYTGIALTAVWCWSWLVVWAVFLQSKADEMTRGMAFIVASVFVAVAGKGLIGHTPYRELIDIIQNIILMVAGGVGGNFMAAYLLKGGRPGPKD